MLLLHYQVDADDSNDAHEVRDTTTLMAIKDELGTEILETQLQV